MSIAPDNHLKTPIPQHVRPGASRTHSSSSVNSKSSSRTHPRPQNDYVPATVGAGAIIGSGEEVIEAGFETTRLVSDGEDEDGGSEEDEDEDAEWETAREGSIARRAKWRRPRPAWIYPFVIGTTMTLGMTGAPKSELYINLSCLVHPPRQPSSVITSVASHPQFHRQPHQPWIGSVDSSINASVPLPEAPAPHKPLSAADKWFLKLQRDIYEYRHSHEALPLPTTTITESSIPSATASLPSEPLPHPTTPADDEEDERHDRPEKDSKPPFRAIDPTLCKKDPEVQAIAAKLVMTLTVTLGILSALTAAFWGKTSDRIGRTKILAICEIGLLVSEVTFVLVASFPHLAPGGYRSLLIGPTCEGLLGGFACLLGTAHAYVSDVTPNGSRAAAFSRLVGVVMFGFACGPVLGAALINATDNIMVPFYVNIAIHAVWPILLLFVLPESLSTEARAHLAKKAAIAAEENRRKDQLQRDWEGEEVASDPGASGWSRLNNAAGSRTGKRIAGNTRRFFKRMFHFLEPLTMFAPQERLDGGKGKNWNLLFIGAAIFCSYTNYGVLQVKAQYTFYAYGWTTTQLGPYLSLAGFSRGFTLLVLIPVATRYIKPHFTKRAARDIIEPTGETEGVVDSAAEFGASRFDLFIARSSLIVEAIGLTCLALKVPALAFVLVTMWMTLGGGSPPALNSLALSMLPNKRESGRLFGAISVLHALGSTLISPLLFGTVFAATVGTYAPTVFILAACNTMLAIFALLFVKLEHTSAAEQAERGRARKARRTRSSATLGH